MASATQARSLRGPIEKGVVYPLPVFMERTGLKRKSVARLRDQGMPVRRVGRNAFVLGDDFLAAACKEK